MAQASGIKNNKCFATGVQGVCKQIESTAAPGASYIFAYNAPQNNSRFVLKEYTAVLFGQIPENPDPDYNFNITIQSADGFTGVLDAVFKFTNVSLDEQGDFLKIYWNNPDFDVSENYTVIHVHIWHDGINWCANIDGYVEATT